MKNHPIQFLLLFLLIGACNISETLAKFTPPRKNAKIIRAGKGTQYPIIQNAVDLLKSGESLEISPGIYKQNIVVKTDNVRIFASAPGVVFDGSRVIPKSKLQTDPKRKGVYIYDLEKTKNWLGQFIKVYMPWIWLDGKKMISSLKPLVGGEKYEFFFNRHTLRLEVAFAAGGMNSKDKNAQLVIPALLSGIEVQKFKNVEIAGISFRNFIYAAVNARHAPELSIKDCFVEWCGFGFITGKNALISRCSTLNINVTAIDCESDSVVEECIVIASRISWDKRLRWGGNVKTNSSSRCLYWRNWVMDEFRSGKIVAAGERVHVRQWAFSSGLWPDIDCYDNAYINNSVARLGHAGIYLEYKSNRNTVAWNTVQDCGMGIVIRQSSMNMIVKNWIFDWQKLAWGEVDTRGYACWGEGFEKNGDKINKFQNHPMWGMQYLEGISLWHAYGEPEFISTTDNIFTDNLLQVSGRAISVPFVQEIPKAQAGEKPEDRGLVQQNSNSYLKAKPFPRTRESDKNNSYAKAKPFSNLIDGNFYQVGKNEHGFAYLGDTQIDDLATVQKTTTWTKNAKVGEFSPLDVWGAQALWTRSGLSPNLRPVAILYDPTFELEGQDSDVYNEPLFWNGNKLRPNYYLKAPISYWDGGLELSQQGRNGSRCLVLETKANHKQAVTWSSSTFPVREEDQHEISFWLAADNIKKNSEKGGIAVFMRFFDINGFLIKDIPFVNSNTRSNMNSGSFDFKNIETKIAIPKQAQRGQFIFSLENCAGRAKIDDVSFGLRPPH